ncbi:ATP-binding protein [Bacillus kexueae]|uniref:ATP-binding protein n=1 Tax=Aeribacillus kexueae TaxID=2078952 RepID=UPI001FAF1F04|nr:ATP-binding protein [Bacillus kexueae]
MKNIKKYFQKSLQRQFAGLLGGFIILFFFGSAILGTYNQLITREYERLKLTLDKKEECAERLNEQFTQAFFDARGYFAFGRKEFKQSFYAQREVVQDSIKQLKLIGNEPEDEVFIEEAELFFSYYFDDLAKNAILAFENGDNEAVVLASENGGTAAIERFQNQLAQYHQSIENQIDTAYDDLKKREMISRLFYVAFILFILLILMFILRTMGRKIGKPLNEVASAAEKFSQDEKVINWKFATGRKDEIGTLSRAFEKMIYSIQEKEEHLVAQNEELQAQQDELEYQQDELESLLEKMKLREKQLEHRNQFIHGISNSLDKHEVLNSIVKSMALVMNAVRGMIVLVNDRQTYASFGLSEHGVKQFIQFIDNGIHQRLFEEKEPFTFKRELSPPEKGFHEENLFSYDIFLPVLSAKQEVEAIMVFSRFGKAFTADEMEEYKSLTKQISISLQKIHLFEESEKDRRMTQDILNNIQEGIQLVDKQGSSLMINSQMTKLLTEQQSGTHLASYESWRNQLLKQVEEPKELEAFLDNVLFQEEDQSKSITYHLKDKRKVIQVYAEALFHGSKQLGTIFVHRDITKEFEVDQMKSEFVSTVSHELRTPLSSVLGFTELMLNKELKPERQQKYLMTIYQEAKRLTSLINDFLDVQRMESGRQTYDKRYEDIVPIIQSVIDTQKVNAPNHQIVVEKETDWTIVLGDRDKLSQVFTNLISNAIKYSPNGGDIKVRLYEQEGNLKVDVADEGLGIPKEALPNLFTKFYRVDNSDRRRIGGTGLGLAIVKEIMKAHDGKVNVTSEEKVGSTFTLMFPLITLETYREVEIDTDGMNVAVIEDDINLAALLSHELSESGFQVHHFKNGKDALKSMKNEKPDAVVLDIMLEEGGMSGWDILKKMKEDPAFTSIPIIISSALEEREKGITLGATDYLVKPYQPSQLSKIILHILLKQEKSGEILIPMPDEEENEDE